MTTFAQVLTRRISHDGAQPLITFYDDATGERVELSSITFGNWVAKVSSLLYEEYDAELGTSIVIDLPTHWLGPVFLAAAWSLGLEVEPVGSQQADLVVCGPETVARWAPSASERPVLACALLPLGVRFAEPLPAGVHDLGVEVWSQPDAFVPFDPPGEVAEFGAAPGPARRVMTTANPVTDARAEFVEALLSGGSLVLVRNGDPQRWASRMAAEQAVPSSLPMSSP